MRKLIETARLGARVEEVAPPLEVDPRREQVANTYINWVHEWREVARVAIARRDYRISLGLAQRRRSVEEDGTESDTTGSSASAST
jgi:hypothetical protein